MRRAWSTTSVAPKAAVIPQTLHWPRHHAVEASALATSSSTCMKIKLAVGHRNAALSILKPDGPSSASITR
jgi:hypothetical protein